MARPLRIAYEGAFYHITSRGNERGKIFFTQTDYDKFKDYLKEAQEKYGSILHSYILMTNHYHLIIETPHANLSEIMHYINSSYTTYINKKKGRSGHLFQGRYKAILVDKDTYLLELSRYLHLNPVRAKIVTKPEEYPHSSYRSYIVKNKEDIVHRDLILGMISQNNQRAYKQYQAFVENAIGEGHESPLKDIYAGVILGSQAFIRHILEKLQNDLFEKEHVSHRRSLKAVHTSDTIIDTLCTHYNITDNEVFNNSGHWRNVAIYLTKKFTSLPNRQIGELFGGLSYSAVAKAYQRFVVRLNQDKSLRKVVEECSGVLS
jgi:REP element-mobilizing transposase RayT